MFFFFVFRHGIFKKEHALLHRIMFDETLPNRTWFWCSKQTRHFSNVFMIIRFKHFHDSLNILFVLAPGCGFSSAKCDKLPSTLTEWN